MQVGVCASVGGWFVEGICDAKLANTTLWVGYATDIASDIMGKPCEPHSVLHTDQNFAMVH